MATFVKNWPNGDTLTLITSANDISVTSDQNLTGADREMTIQVKTTNVGDKVTRDVLVKQQFLDTRSYYVDNYGLKTYFDLADTPIANFCTSGAVSSQITINGTAVFKTFITELFFGQGYSGITSIPDFFLYNLDKLQTLDISALKNITGTGNRFLQGCALLSDIDLSDFSSLSTIGEYFGYGGSFTPSSSIKQVTLPKNVTSIGQRFLGKATSNPVLETVTCLATTPPTLGSAPFFNNIPLEIRVPAGSVNTYKNATNWNVYANIITAI